MAYFTLAGNVYDVQSSNAPASREPVGEVDPAFDGTLRSTVRGYSLSWGPWDLGPLARADAQAVLTVIGLGTVPCGGDALGGGAEFPCVVTCTGWRDLKDTSVVPMDFKRVLTLVIRRVAPVTS